MKILILTNYASVYQGNFIASMQALADFCTSQQDTVHFALSQRTKSREWLPAMEAKYPVHFFAEKRFLADLWTLHCLLKREHYDVVYSHFGASKLASVLALFYRKVTFVQHSHTDMGGSRSWKRAIKLFIKQQFIYRFSYTIFVSKKLQREEQMEQSPRAFWLPNALVQERFDLSRIKQYRDQIRQAWGISSSAPVVLMFGWHPYVKGVDIALRAFDKLAAKQPTLHLLIVPSPKLSKEQANAYAQKFVCADYMSRVHFIAPTNQIEKYYAGADIFLSASRSEGFPYSLLEALYLKKWIVSSQLSGTQWVEKYPTVRTFVSEDVTHCARQILHQVKRIHSGEDDLLNQVSGQVAAQYGIEAWVKQVAQILANWRK